MLEIIITSSVLILAILFIRKICWGKISRRMQYGLWLLVAIRLLVPAQFLTSPVSIMQLVEHEAKQEILQIEENYFVGSENAIIEQKLPQSEKIKDTQKQEEIKDRQHYRLVSS